MKSSFALLAAIGVAGFAQLASAADITGTVTLSGTPPPERDITPLNNDPVCGKLNGGKVSTTFFVVGADKGLADVIVMLKGVPAKAARCFRSSRSVGPERLSLRAPDCGGSNRAKIGSEKFRSGDRPDAQRAHQPDRRRR